jgi:hypothetical protein
MKRKKEKGWRIKSNLAGGDDNLLPFSLSLFGLVKHLDGFLVFVFVIPGCLGPRLPTLPRSPRSPRSKGDTNLIPVHE